MSRLLWTVGGYLYEFSSSLTPAVLPSCHEDPSVVLPVPPGTRLTKDVSVSELKGAPSTLKGHTRPGPGSLGHCHQCRHRRRPTDSYYIPLRQGSEVPRGIVNVDNKPLGVYDDRTLKKKKKEE